ncbi:MAG: hypothetical protein AAF790_15210, partial [Planctomycetota bacterium]
LPAAALIAATPVDAQMWAGSNDGAGDGANNGAAPDGSSQLHYQQPFFPPTAPTSPMRHSSTLAEGYLRGRSNLWQGYGNYLVLREQARLLRDQHYRNRWELSLQKRNENMHMKYLIEQNYKAACAGAIAGREARARKIEQTEKTRYAQTYRLASSVLNRQTGEIAWPKLLRERREFEALVADLDALFRQLASEGPQDDGLYRDRIERTCELLERTLRETNRVAGFDKLPYDACHRFLRGLKFGADVWPAEGDAAATQLAMK